MEFIEKLIETEHSIKLKGNKNPLGSYEDAGFRMFKGIQVRENIYLSIQGSYGSYCTPRKTVNKYEYTNMELAIIKDKEIVPVSEAIDNRELIEEFNNFYGNDVYGYVPVGLLEKLYQELI